MSGFNWSEFRGPLQSSYWTAVAMVLCALTPFLVLSSAIPPLESSIGQDVGLGSPGLEMCAGMADAAYCFGTVLAIQLVTRLPGRRLLLLYAVVFTLATILTALAASPVPFFAGRILQGLTTSLMLITAAPALVLGWPVPRLRSTAVVMNMGIFGAVALAGDRDAVRVAPRRRQGQMSVHPGGSDDAAKIGPQGDGPIEVRPCERL